MVKDNGYLWSIVVMAKYWLVIVKDQGSYGILTAKNTG